ncbi:MAG TPA: rRNA maturation RNase YbeY [Casimicrobiaceae bacterium]|nr:rRNA maturation RNase YbeY [Casimicrobiaceae bacterium]
MPRKNAKKSALTTRTPLSLSFDVHFETGAAGLPRRPTLRRWVQIAQERDLTATLRFVGQREGRRLNARFRGREYATNVLTFVYDDVDPLAGDIVLCVPVLAREASSQGKTLRAHCAHLVIHGMLHLQGYDHQRRADAARMEARETALLRALRYPDPYGGPAR